MAAILKFFKPHLVPYRKLEWAKTWCAILGWYGNSEFLKSFRSDVQDSRHGGHVESLETPSESELLKTIWSDSQDSHRDIMQHIMISLIQVSDFWPTWASSSVLLLACYLLLIPRSLLLIPCSLFLVSHSLFLVPYSLFPVTYSLMLIPCYLFIVPGY